MKKVSAFAVWFSAAFSAVVLSSALTVGCADENDPKTWAKRLDEPAQRAPAIKRLDSFFNDAMGSASGTNKKEDPKVKKVLDDSVEPLAKTYIAGGLDEKTRKDLIKLLGDMGDPRAAPAYAKAFKDHEPGKNDDDVKYAAQGTTRMAQAGQLTDQGLIDALWDCFAKFQPSKNTKSINLVKDLQNAVMVVKDKSFGPKSVEKLAAPVNDPKNPAEGMDQIQFWQLTAARLIGELKYTPGIKPLVKVLLTPTKADLAATVRLALTRMPKESEPILIAALKGADPDFADLASKYPEKAYIPRVAEPIAYISRPTGRDAILEALEKADTDANRTILATDLTHFPNEARTIKAYTDAYNKVPPAAAIALLGGGNGRAIIAQSAANFFDPSLTEWLLKEVASAKGEAADALSPAALQAAIKLMAPGSAKAVGDAVAKIPGAATEKDMYKSAHAVLDKCKQDAACYVGVLDTAVPSTPPTAKMGHVKAAWMAAIYGNADIKAQLVGKVDKIKDGSVRLAMIEAIDHLSPQGDAASAEKLEAIVEADKKAGVNYATEEVYKHALKLRSRVP
jgi:HEAT repeat protein